MKLRPVGEHALLCEVDDLPTAHALARAAARLPTVLDAVPGMRTVLVVSSAHDASWLAEQVTGLALDVAAGAGAEHELPAVYEGPDLAEVADRCGLSIGDIVRRHAAATYTVAFLGFAPGFPYLVGLDPALAAPRRATPRTSVPAGSIGIAGDQTGVYPSALPGGWQLIARTDAVLFDPDREPPALLAPGDRVRFRPVPSLAARLRTPRRPKLSGNLRHSVVVERAGPLTTVQDTCGRPGYARYGVPRAGAVDRPSLAVANQLVGNPGSAPGLECTVQGPALRATCDLQVAVVGDVAVRVDGRSAPTGEPLAIPAGTAFDVGRVSRGVRAYVAITGGIDVPPVLGSPCTDTLSGLGPPPLRAGDRLPVRSVPDGIPACVEPSPALPDEPVLHIRWGPRDDVLTPSARSALLSTPWRVDPRSDRTGVRLDGPALPDAGDGRLPSEGMVPGAVQIPPDGRPIVFLANAPTTGGYPVVAVVAERDLRFAAQARPGSTVRFAQASP